MAANSPNGTRGQRSDVGGQISDLGPPTSAPGRVLVVDDHAGPASRWPTCSAMPDTTCKAAGCAAEALEVLKTAHFDCIVTDLQMPGMTGIEFIIQLRQRQCATQIVMVTAHATVASAVEAMRHGAFDYIEKPFDADALERLVDRAMRHGRLVHRNRPQALAGRPASPAMIGSEPVDAGLADADRCKSAPTAETVLITGESGTGKELVARAMHAASHRHGTADGQLELPGAFGPPDGKRTVRPREAARSPAPMHRAPAVSKLAHGGTILLDEVTEIDLPLQAKLLRVLQEKSFERVGSQQDDARRRPRAGHDEPRPAAGSGRRADSAKTFTTDWPYCPLTVPPLRQRREDVPELAAYFFKRSAQRLQRESCKLDADAAAVARRLPLAGQRPRVGKHRHAGQRADDDRPRHGRRICAAG